MTSSSAVHREGVAAFASLPGDSYAYRIDYADADGRVWLKSSATDREWCVLISLSVAVQGARASLDPEDVLVSNTFVKHYESVAG